MVCLSILFPESACKGCYAVPRKNTANIRQLQVQGYIIVHHLQHLSPSTPTTFVTYRLHHISPSITITMSLISLHCHRFHCNTTKFRTVGAVNFVDKPKHTPEDQDHPGLGRIAEFHDAVSRQHRSLKVLDCVFRAGPSPRYSMRCFTVCAYACSLTLLNLNAGLFVQAISGRFLKCGQFTTSVSLYIWAGCCSRCPGKITCLRNLGVSSRDTTEQMRSGEVSKR